MSAGMRGLHFAWRGWISAALFFALAAARRASDLPLWTPALVLVAAGMAWRLYAGRYIPAHSNGAAMAEGPLATGGPYAFGRHPLYLSNFAVAAGLVLFAHCLPWWGALALLAVVAAHYVLLARSEERFLLARLGADYAGYLRATPRWAGRPRRAGAGAAAPLSAALARQFGNLAKAAACVLLILLASHA